MSSFQRHFSYLSNENIIHRLYKFSERLLSKIMNDYSTTVTNKQLYVTYIIGGQAGVFINWLSNGCNESPEEVADILLANTIKLQNQ